VKVVEDRLRVLILDTGDPDSWHTAIDTIDSPPIGLAPPDLDGSIRTALDTRTDIARARKDIENADTNVKYTKSQKLPDVRLSVNYLASGLGGTEIVRTGTFPGTIVGSGAVTDFGSVLNQLFSRNYPTWTAGVSVTYPLGESVEQANAARAKLERAQSDERLKSAQAKVVQQIRDASWKIDMNAKRIDTTRAARALAEQRLDSEQKRFEVGLSTNFLVIQAQRDLAQAQTNELSAILDYDLSLVDFDALQEAGPAGAAPATATPAATTGAPITPPAPVSPVRTTTVIPGVPTGGQ
jgi:outer membrane protein TolC